MRIFCRCVILLLLMGFSGFASCAEKVYPLDHFPVGRLNQPAALQRGARIFANYCQGCHGISAVRYSGLQKIGLTLDQIQENLMFTGDKAGDLMKTAMRPEDGRLWFGTAPPDLSLIARARSSEAGSGADWLYTYLRTFFRDQNRPSGWNNALFENVAMPHVLGDLQGPRSAVLEEVREILAPDGTLTFVKVATKFDSDGTHTQTTEVLPPGHHHAERHWSFGAPDADHPASQYDGMVADLVAYLAYVSEPSAALRRRIGVGVLLFLTIFASLAYWLNREYWKNVK